MKRFIGQPVTSSSGNNNSNAPTEMPLVTISSAISDSSPPKYDDCFPDKLPRYDELFNDSGVPKQPINCSG